MSVFFDHIMEVNGYHNSLVPTHLQNLASDRRRKVIQVLNKMRLSKRWQNLNFGDFTTLLSSFNQSTFSLLSFIEYIDSSLTTLNVSYLGKLVSK